LVNAWRDPAERPRLAKAVGSSVKELMPAVFVANLLMQEAPGIAGINLLLQHKDETIPNLEDTEDDHEFVTRDRQGMIGFAGYMIHLYESLHNKYGILPKLKYFAWAVGLYFLALIGVIVFTNWRALSGGFGSDVTSQLAQQLNRREALYWVILAVGFIGVSGFAGGGLWIKNRVEAWLDDAIDRKMGQTPRDVLVWMEAQDRIPPAWGNAENTLNNLALAIWFAPLLASIFLPGILAWASWIIFGLLFGWMLLKSRLFNLGFNKIEASWAQQARPYQAGLFQAKMVARALFLGFFYLVVTVIAGGLIRGTDTWTRAYTQSTRTDTNVWLTQQTLDETDRDELKQYILERTDELLAMSQERVNFWDAWLPVIVQTINAGLFAIVFGATLGWFLFIRQDRLIKALLFFTIAYLVVEIIPEIASWWLFQTPQTGYASQDVLAGLLAIFGQTFVTNIRGLTIGLFLALGQAVLESTQARDLNYECPNCHQLHVAPCCQAGQLDGFEQVLPLL